MKFVISSSITLGLIVGVGLLIAGETTANINLTLEFGAFDGVWWIVGVPVLALLTLALVSPLSFFLHRQLTKNDSD